MADQRFNRLLIVPFHERWKARERIRKGEPLYGGFTLSSTSGEPSEGSWQAKPSPVPKDATAEAFKLLGLDASTATEEDVRRRYRAAAFEAHPDRGGSTQRFHAVSEAKDTCLKAVRTNKK